MAHAVNQPIGNNTSDCLITLSSIAFANINANNGLYTDANMEGASYAVPESLAFSDAFIPVSGVVRPCWLSTQ